MSLRKVPVTWQTGAGGTGVSIFYTQFGTDVTVELGTFFNAIKGNFPSAVTWAIPSSGDVIDEVTGKITGAWTGGTAGGTAGSTNVAYAAGTGVYIRWQTAGIVNGRRVKGRTFLCPLVASDYQNDGTIIDANLVGMNNAATTLAASGKLNIWHRPTSSTSNDGSAHLVVGATGPDRVTSLRSRRV
jgi:hypothetical protein